MITSSGAVSSSENAWPSPAFIQASNCGASMPNGTAVKKACTAFLL